MLNKQFTEMLNEKDIIFEIAGVAQQRAQVVGAENVYNFSLGGPSVPAPEAVREAITRLARDTDPMTLHRYSPGKGIPEVRAAIANQLNRRYGSHYTAEHIFMTAGAGAALCHAFHAVADPGREVLTFAPYFPEYVPYTAGAGLTLKVVPADIETFQIPMDTFEAMLNPNVAAVLINSPNNPSGIVYSTETIRRLAEILERKSAEFGHPIFLISDEPYREILFQGADSPYISNFYKNSISCYSFSKSLSMPGERIGYLAVNPDSNYAADIIELCPQISRTTGHNGANALMQRVVAETCSTTSDLRVYEENKKILFSALTEYGFHCVEPGGGFYMFPRSLEPDSMAFCKQAMDMDLMLVPGDNFGCPGHFRIAYCVPTERVIKALPVFRRLAESYR